MLTEFEKIIGADVFAANLAMLKEIGPDARTHRISVVIAAMLRYALSQAPRKSKKNSLSAALVALDDGPLYADEGSVEYRKVAALIDELCSKAGMRNRRLTSKGMSYSIAQNAIAEYCAWHNMPWEGY